MVFVNNGFLEEEKATLGITDLSIHRGYGIFDFFRTRNYIPIFLDDYLNRFYNSANLLRLPIPFSKPDLKNIISEMIRRNKVADAGFKMILTGGYSSDGYQLSSPNFIIIPQPVQMPDQEKFEKGSKIILHEYMREMPRAKSINYLVGVYLQQEVQQQKADDVLYYKDGYVLEFPRSNVFAVTKEGTVVTPAENVLWGITRSKVLELALKKYKVEERAITVDELKNAAEVFLTNTTKRIFPVLAIGDKNVSNGKSGEVTRELYKDFLQMENALVV